MIEKAKCRIAALLNFCNYKTSADGVNRPRGHKSRVAGMHRLPSHQIGDRAVIYGIAELLRRKVQFQPKGNL